MSLRDLQQALPTWVRIERHPATPVVQQAGGLVEVNAFPATPPNAAVRADVHFVAIAPTEGLPEPGELKALVRSACGEGEFEPLTDADLNGGPSYITLDGWLGSQDLALMLIGATELVGLGKAVTPAAIGVTGEAADQMAGMGFVMLAPSVGWGADDD